MSWFERLRPKIKASATFTKKGVPEGVWSKCDACAAVLYAAEVERNASVCMKCGHHGRLNARARIAHTLDDGSAERLFEELKPVDVLKFRDSKRYRDRLSDAGKQSGESEALIVARGNLIDLPVVIAAFEFAFMGGSMGSVVGERFARAVDICVEQRRPLICFAASGGARMQEALLSLMQMAKTTAALTRLAEARIPFVSVLTDPTMGGVSASLAMLGDIVVAEPKALIGFAGPRVIEQTVREKLPEGFQRAEFLLEHGAIDMIVDRRQLRNVIHQMLSALVNTHADAPEPHTSLPAPEPDQDADAENAEAASG